MHEGAVTRPILETNIPSDWSWEQLRNLISRSYSGGTPDRENLAYFVGGTIPWIKSGELNQINVRATEEHITEEGLKHSSARVVPSGTLLFAMYGATAGVVGFTEIEAALNQAVLAIFPDSKKLNKRFLFYFLQFQKGRILTRFTQGGQPNLSSGLVKALHLPVPPLAEQKSIADLLNSMDKGVETNERLIAQKELRKKWLMQNLLTGRKRLSGFTGGWRTVRVADLFGKVYRYAKWDDTDAYKLISLGRRYRGVFDRGDLFGHQIEVKKIKFVRKGDFLISKRQVSHGAWAVVTDQFDGRMVSDEYDCLIVNDDKNLDMQFWAWFCQQPLLTHWAYVASNGVHLEKLIFDFDSFKKREVMIPPTLKEQRAIAHVLDVVSEEIVLLRTKSARLLEQKKGMMQQLLTGKKRLKKLGDDDGIRDPAVTAQN